MQHQHWYFQFFFVFESPLRSNLIGCRVWGACALRPGQKCEGTRAPFLPSSIRFILSFRIILRYRVILFTENWWVSQLPNYRLLHRLSVRESYLRSVSVQLKNNKWHKNSEMLKNQPRIFNFHCHFGEFWTLKTSASDWTFNGRQHQLFANCAVSIQRKKGKKTLWNSCYAHSNFLGSRSSLDWKRVYRYSFPRHQGIFWSSTIFKFDWVRIFFQQWIRNITGN